MRRGGTLEKVFGFMKKYVDKEGVRHYNNHRWLFRSRGTRDASVLELVDRHV